MAIGDVKSAIVPVKDSTTKWAASTAYSLGALVIPTAGATWWVYECTTAGTSGTTEPAWPTTEGATVTDGTVVWTCRARYLDIRPPAGEEWVIHNITHNAAAELFMTDGTNHIGPIDSDTGTGGWLNFNFHVTNSVWYRVRNVSGSVQLIGYDGICTRSA
jgi:hypothetical protein